MRGIRSYNSVPQGYEVHQSGALLWILLFLLLSGIALGPLLTIASIAFIPSAGRIWSHLIAHVLPDALWNTLLLTTGVGLISMVMGVVTAWIVSMYHFPGRFFFSRFLAAPLAIPAYITGYCYVELLDYSGPIQMALRSLLGWQSASAYSFPEISSLGGAIFVMSVSLYPYSYIAACLSFRTQSRNLLSVGRTLGHTGLNTFLRIALPLARPALTAGTLLACMEVLNDIGTVEFLGVQTLTVSIYTTWQGRKSLVGAAQLSVCLLLLVFSIIQIERLSRGKKRFFQPATAPSGIKDRLHGWQACLAATVCAIPIFLGFGLPIATLMRSALPHLTANLIQEYIPLIGNSLLVSIMTALFAVCAALLLAYGRFLVPEKMFRIISCISTIGYTVPGTILAIGIFISVTLFENSLDTFLRHISGFSSGLFLSGSIFCLTLALVIRFLAVANSSIESRMETLNPHIALAARTLGASHKSTFLRIQLPLSRTACATAGLLVFVESVKELPATLLLRPFDFDTLATHVYTYASLERFQDATLPALIIALVGLLPILFLNPTLRYTSVPKLEISQSAKCEVPEYPDKGEESPDWKERPAV